AIPTRRTPGAGDAFAAARRVFWAHRPGNFLAGMAERRRTILPTFPARVGTLSARFSQIVGPAPSGRKPPPHVPAGTSRSLPAGDDASLLSSTWPRNPGGSPSRFPTPRPAARKSFAAAHKPV